MRDEAACVGDARVFIVVTVQELAHPVVRVPIARAEYAGTLHEDVTEMADVDVDQWLEGWVENNLTAPGYVEAKAEMRDQAEACAVAATSEGISIAEIKEAAGGDLEAYLLDRQNASTDAEVGHRSSKDA